MEQPKVKPGDWVIINKGGLKSYKAVICSVGFVRNDCIEAVYLEKDYLHATKKPHERKALQTCLIWENDKWTFDDNFLTGYADNFTRISEFVVQLREGLTKPL